MINLYPTKCNLCGGEVIYTTNDKIYGKPYGSGYCYLCTKCGAYVGTHVHRTKQALGILANKDMRLMKMKCHELFDRLWSNQKSRDKAYGWLADKMGIEKRYCHFGYFDLQQLEQAYEILENVMFVNEEGGS